MIGVLPVHAGTYVVDITDAMGCTTQETVVITEPIPYESLHPYMDMPQRHMKCH